MEATTTSPWSWVSETCRCPKCGHETVREKPVLLPIPDVVYLLDICERFVWTLIDAGDLTVVTLGRRKLVPRASIDELITRRLAENYERTARKRRGK